MSSRTYLSIGDVLTLLREEFPDVTISKIRFLESQGLVNPERSPSGYRKFFDHDVERLRWVLRQQREHFLPLKVIRDRLADGDLGDGDGDGDGVGAERPNGKAVQPAHAVAVGASGHAQEQPTKADEEAMARILADASRRAARLPEDKQARAGLQVVAEAEAVKTAAAEIPAQHENVTTAAAPQRRTAAERRADATLSVRPVAPTRASAPAATTGHGNGTAVARPAEAPAAPRRDPTQDEAGARKSDAKTPEAAPTLTPTPTPAASPAAPVVTGASLSAEELCASSGLSLDELAGLKGFGLVECVSVAGIETYDEDALTVANLAAAFRAFGIEPRHLRLYRNAADRELGLIEQVVIPLLRQRNPESRRRAVDGADQLAALGQSMRATLLRQSLGRHLGG